MFSDRKPLYQKLAKTRRSNVLVYITGDRPGLETQVSSEAYAHFVNHLDRIGVVPKISLYLYTRGGDALTAWSLVNLIRQFCEAFEVIIPSRALSAGTLIALGANNIVMTKQATLSPVDPSINDPLNPRMPNAPQVTLPVSVEAVQAFADLARKELEITDGAQLSAVLIKLMEAVHPLVLGRAYRTRAQIQMLARRLVSKQITNEEKVQKLIDFLCSDSGSHDYTIHRREARDSLGLKVNTPNDRLYALIKLIYDDIAKELALGSSNLDPNGVLGTEPQADYSFRRALIESDEGGTDVFVTEGTYRRVSVPLPPAAPPGLPVNFQQSIEDRRTFEGWRHEP